MCVKVKERKFKVKLEKEEDISSQKRIPFSELKKKWKKNKKKPMREHAYDLAKFYFMKYFINSDVSLFRRFELFLWLKIIFCCTLFG